MKILGLCLMVLLTGCAGWNTPPPTWAIDSCLRAHGTPVWTSDAWGNEGFQCVINDGRNSLNARYFNDQELIEDLPEVEDDVE